MDGYDSSSSVISSTSEWGGELNESDWEDDGSEESFKELLEMYKECEKTRNEELSAYKQRLESVEELIRTTSRELKKMRQGDKELDHSLSQIHAFKLLLTREPNHELSGNRRVLLEQHEAEVKEEYTTLRLHNEDLVRDRKRLMCLRSTFQAELDEKKAQCMKLADQDSEYRIKQTRLRSRALSRTSKNSKTHQYRLRYNNSLSDGTVTRKLRVVTITVPSDITYAELDAMARWEDDISRLQALSMVYHTPGGKVVRISSSQSMPPAGTLIHVDRKTR